MLINKSTNQYDYGYEAGLYAGSQTTINAIVSMLERELRKNNEATAEYKNTIETIINKIKEMNNAKAA